MKKILLTLLLTLSTLSASLYYEDRKGNPYNAVKGGRAAESGYCFAVKKGKLIYMKKDKADKLGAIPFRYQRNAKSYIVKTTGKAAQASGLNSSKGL